MNEEEIEKIVERRLNKLNSIEVGHFKMQSFDLNSKDLTALTIKTLANPTIKSYLDVLKNSQIKTQGYFG